MPRRELPGHLRLGLEQLHMAGKVRSFTAATTVAHIGAHYRKIAEPVCKVGALRSQSGVTA